MPSAWVDYVKQFAAKKGISYGCAMSDPACKAGYAATKGSSPKEVVKITKSVNDTLFKEALSYLEKKGEIKPMDKNGFRKYIGKAEDANLAYLTEYGAERDKIVKDYMKKIFQDKRIETGFYNDFKNKMTETKDKNMIKTFSFLKEEGIKKTT